ncbi:MAG TPA: DUF6010 family protein [Longimicrobiaceae bacterium]
MIEQIGLLVVGAALAAGFAAILRLPTVRNPGRRHGTALLVAALIYVVFAVVGESVSGVAVELAGVAAFGAIAVAGIRRRSPALLAFGWAVHTLWDVLLHSSGPGFLYTPRGYAALCIGFDLVLAALIAKGWAGRTEPRTSAVAEV